MEYDLFISHASEDKANVARPLAIRLRENRYKVWYDEFVLHVGDSLTQQIDYGLANSQAGILILSPDFIRKPWPQRELAGLTARYLRFATRLIPVWHQVGFDEVLAFSPPLADIKAVRSDEGLDVIVRQLLAVVSPSMPPPTNKTVEEALEMIEAGEYDFAVRTALLALDRRLFLLIESMRKKGLVASELRIAGTVDAPIQAIDLLNASQGLVVPEGVDIEWLKMEISNSSVLSFAVPGSPDPQVAVRFVSDVERLLRVNPCPGVLGAL